ncbi:MAG: RHS repeat protein, partial [Verrucomicrobiota bacterium]|nr:RHS repeat protein [Verrucomicrobiota bacterium]
MLTKSGRMVEGDYTHYDALGRRILVSDPSGGTLHYHYDATGNPVEQDKSGLIWSNTFNALNQPIETTASGGLVVWGKTISLLPATVTVNARTAQPWGPYWAATNIPFTPGTNSLNVLLSDTAGRSATQSIAFVAQDKRYAYDPNGNMITNGTYTYIWDDENRLVEVRQHGVCLQKNRYDGLGRRREKVEYVAGAVLTNRYLYHGWLVLAITDGSGEILETYTHGADLSGQIGGEAGGIGGLLSSTREAEEVFYHYD